jgi:hypothetical protein
MVPSHAQYRTALSAKLQGWRRRQSRRLPGPWHDAVRVLLRLDLDPARPLLRALSMPLAREDGLPTTPSASSGPSS